MPASVEDRMAKLGFPKPSAKTIPSEEDKPAMARKKVKPKPKLKAAKKQTTKKKVTK